MSLYTKFCAWLSGWPESSGNASDGRSHHEEDGAIGVSGDSSFQPYKNVPSASISCILIIMLF